MKVAPAFAGILAPVLHRCRSGGIGGGDGGKGGDGRSRSNRRGSALRSVSINGTQSDVAPGERTEPSPAIKSTFDPFPNDGRGSWSCTATVVHGEHLCGAASSPSVAISHRVDGDDDEERRCVLRPIKRVGSKLYDLSLQRDWMEFVDESGQSSGETDWLGGSAYDVLRCDMVWTGGGCVAIDAPSSKSSLASTMPPPPVVEAIVKTDGGGDASSPRWKVWGEEFHLNRLRRSFTELVRSSSSLEDEDRAPVDDVTVQGALRDSLAVMRALLLEAHKSKLLESIRELSEVGTEGAVAQLVRVSLLWTPTWAVEGEEDGEGTLDSDCTSTTEGAAVASRRRRRRRGRIVVRGHACSTGEVFSPHHRPASIVASLAVKGQESVTCVEDGGPLQRLDGGTALPNRQGSPQLKISSWSRLRRPLETGRFKPRGVSEVLMVRPVKKEEGGEDDDPGMEILEGLTSNFFAVYRDGTIRTAQEGVLFGYARHLILEVAERCGLTTDQSPVLMQDALDGKWVEAFITSSSRLIFPIEMIVAPKASLCIVEPEKEREGADNREEEGLLFEEFWKAPENDSTLPWKTPRWEALYDEMLREGGYN